MKFVEDDANVPERRESTCCRCRNNSTLLDRCVVHDKKMNVLGVCVEFEAKGTKR